MTFITNIVATYWTISGPVLPGSANEASPFGFAERVEAAAAAGFKGLGFVHDDLEAVRAAIGYTEMRRILTANGIDDVEVELIGDWFTDGERRAKSDCVRRNLLAAGEALHARGVKVCGDMTGAAWPQQGLIDNFAGLCTDFAKLGMKVGIEIMPWTNFSTIANTLPIVESVGAANGGLFLDVWHMERGGVDLAEIGRLDRRWITSIEINDAKAEMVGGLWNDTLDHRLPPGAGSFDIRRFMQEVKKTGYVGPCGVEILSIAQWAMPLREAAQTAFDTTRAYVEEA